MHDFFPVEFPYTLGTDLAGIIEQVGADMTGWSVGDRVVTRTDPPAGGALAEVAVVPATHLAKLPASLVINYSSGSDQAEALVAKIEAAGGTAIAVNLKNVFNGLREAAKSLREGGRIVSFSPSVVGLYQPTYALDAASKAGIEAMTHIVAKELGSRSITVNAVAPGPVDTPLFTEGKSKEQIDASKKMNPFGRLGEPEDIARVVSFLTGPNGGWISGQVLRANGGEI